MKPAPATVAPPTASSSSSSTGTSTARRTQRRSDNKPVWTPADDRSDQDLSAYSDAPPDETGGSGRELRCMKYITLSREALAGQDYAQAMTYADRARVANMSERHAGDAELASLFEEIDKVAAELLAAADAKLEADALAEAYQGYVVVQRSFAALDAGKQASARMAEIRRKGATVLAEIEFNSLMDLIGDAWKTKNAGSSTGRVKVDAVEVIMDMAPEQQRAAVQQILTLVERYGATTYGEKARTLLEKLKAAHAEKRHEANKDVASL